MHQTATIEDSVFRSNAAIFSGGRDPAGSSLIVFPVAGINNLEQLGTASIVQLVHSYVKMTKVSNQSYGFSFIADLRNCNNDVIETLADVLTALQGGKQGMVSTLYVLRPKSRAKHCFMKKILGLKESKKTPRVAVCKIVVLKDLSDLQNHVSRTNLTEDYGGTIRYNQESWLRFYKLSERIADSLHCLLPRLPDAKDKVQLLHEYECPSSTAEELAFFLDDLYDKYNAIVSEIDLEATIDCCRNAIEQLDTNADQYLNDIPTSLLLDTKSYLRASMTTLITSREELVKSWKEMEENVTRRLKLIKFRDQVTKLNTHIICQWMTKVEAPPVLSCTLAQAENYRNIFLTTIYEPCKELIAKATALMKGVVNVKNNAKSEDVTFIDHLSNTVHTFAEKLENNNKIYIALHIFFLMFEKLALWYEKVLRFLPSSLSRYLDRAKRKKLMAFPVLPKWTQTARNFLDKHPSPRNEHISRIETPNVELPDQQISTQAYLLARRIRTLMAILSTNEHFITNEVDDALMWKKSVEKSEDAIIIPRGKSQSDDMSKAGETSCSQNLRERPATALGITDKKGSVTFASEVTDNDRRQLEYRSDHNQSPMNQEFEELDFRRHSISMDKYQENALLDETPYIGQNLQKQTKWSHSTDNLLTISASEDTFKSRTRDHLEKNQERYISLNSSHDNWKDHFIFQNQGLYHMFPEHFHTNGGMLSPQLSPNEDLSTVGSNLGKSVFYRLQDIMNSNMAPEMKVEHAQILLKADGAQSGYAPSSDVDKQKDGHCEISQYNKYRTKSLPNLDLVESKNCPLSFVGSKVNTSAWQNRHDSLKQQKYRIKRDQFHYQTQNYSDQNVSMFNNNLDLDVDDWIEPFGQYSNDSDEGVSDGSQLPPVVKRQLQRVRGSRRSSKRKEEERMHRDEDSIEHTLTDAKLPSRQEYYIRRHKLPRKVAERRLSCPLYVSTLHDHADKRGSSSTDTAAKDSDKTHESTDPGYASSDIFAPRPFRVSRPCKSSKKFEQKTARNDSRTSSDTSFMNQDPTSNRQIIVQFVGDDEIDDSAPVVITKCPTNDVVIRNPSIGDFQEEIENPKEGMLEKSEFAQATGSFIRDREEMRDKGFKVLKHEKRVKQALPAADKKITNPVNNNRMKEPKWKSILRMGNTLHNYRESNFNDVSNEIDLDDGNGAAKTWKPMSKTISKMSNPPDAVSLDGKEFVGNIGDRQNYEISKSKNKCENDFKKSRSSKTVNIDIAIGKTAEIKNQEEIKKLTNTNYEDTAEVKPLKTISLQADPIMQNDQITS